MNKKIFLTVILSLLLVLTLYTASFASNVMNSAKNAVTNAGNAVGGAIVTGKNAVVDGAKSLTNGTVSMGTDVMNTTNNVENNTDSAVHTLGNDMESDYTATRTSTTDTNAFGLSTFTWTLIIIGIVGAAIVALVWYYGSQYEHKDYYNN